MIRQEKIQNFLEIAIIRAPLLIYLLMLMPTSVVVGLALNLLLFDIEHNFNIAFSSILFSIFLFFVLILIIVILSKFRYYFLEKKVKTCKDTSNIESLEKLANNRLIYYEAIIALGNIKSKSSEEALIHILNKGKVSIIRRFSAHIIGELRIKSAVIILTKKLKETNSQRERFVYLLCKAKIEGKNSKAIYELADLKTEGELSLIQRSSINDLNVLYTLEELNLDLGNFTKEIDSLKNDDNKKAIQSQLLPIQNKINKIFDLLAEPLLTYQSEFDVATNELKQLLQTIKDSPEITDKSEIQSKMIISMTKTLAEIGNMRSQEEKWRKELNRNLAVSIFTFIAAIASIIVSIFV